MSYPSAFPAPGQPGWCAPHTGNVSAAPAPKARPAHTASKSRVSPAWLAEPPRLKELSVYLDRLPPMISRKEVKYFTGGAVSSKKLANDDSLGRGPRVRQLICGAVVYPTEFFLEYLESQGVTTIAPPKF